MVGTLAVEYSHVKTINPDGSGHPCRDRGTGRGGAKSRGRTLDLGVSLPLQGGPLHSAAAAEEQPGHDYGRGAARAGEVPPSRAIPGPAPRQGPPDAARGG